jgi:UDP:flavonoid glycosyltransferase YjiC (YdhE family)
MARFLFASTPVAAHSATPRPIVRRLVERGHEVIWYAGEAYADRIRATGARYAPMVAALDVSTGDPYDWFPHIRELDGLAAIKATFTEIFLGQIEPGVADLERLLEDFPADVLVSDILVGRTANIVMERGGPVNALLNDTALAQPSPDFPPWGRGMRPWHGVLGPLNRTRNRLLRAALRFAFRDVDAEYTAIRARLGLPPDSRWLFDAGASRFLHLQGTVPEFEYVHRALDPQVHFVGPFRPDPPGPWQPPSWWGDLDGPRPIVHVTQGTIRANAGELLRPALEALAGEDVLVVATTGAVDPDDLAPLPTNARIAPFIPYDELLVKADLFLTNGGYVGTNMALRHGVPVVAVGATEDKAEIGARVVHTGVGLALPTRTPTPAAIRDAVRAVLMGASYHQAAALVARSMAACDATATAVELLERLVHDQRPIPRATHTHPHPQPRSPAALALVPPPPPTSDPAPSMASAGAPARSLASPAGMASLRSWASAVRSTVAP